MYDNFSFSFRQKMQRAKHAILIDRLMFQLVGASLVGVVVFVGFLFLVTISLAKHFIDNL